MLRVFVSPCERMIHLEGEVRRAPRQPKEISDEEREIQQIAMEEGVDPDVIRERRMGPYQKMMYKVMTHFQKKDRHPMFFIFPCVVLFLFYEHTVVTSYLAQAISDSLVLPSSGEGALAPAFLFPGADILLWLCRQLFHVAVVCYFIAMMMDPGTVQKNASGRPAIQKHIRLLEETDDPRKIDFRFCETCKVLRDYRTKHCAKSDCCVDSEFRSLIKNLRGTHRIRLLLGRYSYTLSVGATHDILIRDVNSLCVEEFDHYCYWMQAKGKH
jgi:hypothetical protein